MKSVYKVWNWIVAKIDTPVWLEVFFVIVVILRIPSFFEPFYYGDEMIYLTLGQGIRQGIPLYLGLHDNKPPLLYIMAAIAGNVFMFKALLAVFNLWAIYLFWKIVTNLSPKQITFQKVATVIFGLITTLPLLEGNIANAENFMMVPTLLAFYFVLTKEKNFKNLFTIGFLFSVAALFKIVAAFDIIGLFAFWLISLKFNIKSFAEFVKNVIYLSIGFTIPILATFVWYYLRGALQPYIIAAFLQNIGYVSSWKRAAAQDPFLIKNAPLLIRFGIMVLGFGILWLSRKKISKPFLLTSAWLLATLFAVTLSERPYPHYLLQSTAPVSILLGMLFTYKNIEQSLAVIPLTLALFIPYFYKFWYYPTTTYYTRFIKFATQQISREDYFTSFSGNLVRNYKIADFLSQSANKNDRVFVWSNDSAGIYALSRRLPPTKYVADYHFLDFSTKEETINTLSANMPKFIVITPNAPEFNELTQFAKQYYLPINQIDSAQIWLKI
jgi:hypothetical protein